MTSARFAGALIVIVAIAASVETAAQSRRRPAPPAFYQLSLEEGIAPIGRMGGFSGRAGAAGHRIVAENLSVVQPVTVLAIASDAAEPVRVELVKGAWDRAVRSATTDEGGRVVFRTRTEGNLGIVVRSAGDRPASYVLAVWAGDEMPSEPAPIFTARSDRRAARGGADRGTRVVWLVVGLVMLAVAGLYLWRRQVRGRTAP